MKAEDIFKTIMEADGEDMHEKLAELERKVKAEFLAELPGAEDEITIKRGDFVIRVRDTLAKANMPSPCERGDIFQVMARGMKNIMISQMLEKEFFGEPKTEDGGDEEEH